MNVGKLVPPIPSPVVAFTSETPWLGITLPVGSATVIFPLLAISAPPELVVNSATYVRPGTPAAVEDSVTEGPRTEDAAAAAGATESSAVRQSTTSATRRDARASPAAGLGRRPLERARANCSSLTAVARV